MIVSLISAFAFTLAALLACVVFLRRSGIARRGGELGVPFAVVQKLSVAPRQGVALVRVGRRVLAVSVGEGGVRTLGEMASEDVALLDAHVADDAPDFAAQLERAVAREGLPQVRRWATRVRGWAMRSRTMLVLVLAGAAVALLPDVALAQDASALAPNFDLQLGGGQGEGVHISGPVGVVLMMGLLTLLPTLILLGTSFTRILVVFTLLRQGLGTMSAPPAHLLAALSFLLTLYVMGPTMEIANRDAIQPYLAGQMTQGQAFQAAAEPFRAFMLRNTREQELALFAEMSGRLGQSPKSPEEMSTISILCAFTLSELKTAFLIGFSLLLPFVILDLVVGSILLSLGMFMLSPALVSMPFKLLLFVLADGWFLVVRSLVLGYN